MHYILVITLMVTATGSPTTLSVEYNNQASCQTAQTAWLAAMPGGSTIISALCTAKGQS